jgi:Uma2 family endonuclease
MAARVVLTYADYAAIPNDGRRYEVHEGEISVTPAPRPAHQELVGNLLVLVHEHVRAHRLGKVFPSPIDCILSDTTIVQPDIAYVETARLPIVSRRGLEGAPTLVVEVISPSTIEIDRHVKFQLYARHGVPHYWVADVDMRVIEGYALVEGTYQIAGRLEGTRTAALAPFLGLPLDPSTLWP